MDTGARRRGEDSMPGLRNVLEYFRMHGIRYTFSHGMEKMSEKYLGTYDRLFRAMQPTKEELAEQERHQHQIGKISILIPVYRPRPAFLEALLDSLLAQTEKNWQACIYHAGEMTENHEILEKYAQKDPRFLVRHSSENEGISGNTNRAFDMADGEWVALCDHDDILSPSALWLVADTIEKEQPDVVYTDEDKITENGKVHTDAHLKPDFCPDTLCSSNYVCHLLVFRRELMERIGGERSTFDGSQDHDLMLRLSECTGRICHVPAVCYHWRTVGSSMSHMNLMRCLEASCKAVQEHMEKKGYPVEAVPKNGVIRLKYEIIRPLRVQAFVYGKNEESIRELELSDWKEMEITSLSGDGNRWEAYNRAAAGSEADVLLFVDETVNDIPSNMVREMLMYAQREDVGAVVPALTDSRGHVLHAGFVYPLSGYAQCRQEGLLLGAGGWHILLQQSHNVGAVSGACFMIRKDHWIPFDPAYHGGLGAVDWSIRLGHLGLNHVYTPHGAARVRRSELLLSGTERDPDDLRRIEKMFGDEQDRCYHPGFRRTKADFRMDRQGEQRRRMQE